MAPKDEAEMRDMLLTAIDYPGPAAIRYPRGNGQGVDISSPPKRIEIGKAEILRDGGDVAIIAYGEMVYPAVDAGNKLAASGIQNTVVNARFVKPLDSEALLELARNKRLIVTVEDAYLAGGFGSAVLELLEENDLANKTKVVRMGVPDKIVTHGDPKLLMAEFGLDVEGIISRVTRSLESLDEKHPGKNRIKAVG
jgi:1-deoxy-D-xylulose-5-phosphate synthase